MSIHIGKKKINLQMIKEPETVDPKPNLLVNGDFQINQKGKDVYYGDDTVDSPFGIRTVDRLYLQPDKNTRLYRLENGGLKFHQEKGNTELFIEGPALRYILLENECFNFISKTVTLSIKLNNYSHSSNPAHIAIYDIGNLSTPISDTLALTNGLNRLTFVLTRPTMGINIEIRTISKETIDFDIEYIKLELGDSSTPNISKPYLEELAACQAGSLGNILVYSNPNLLINSNFKINQRGLSTYTTANTYTVDRWKLVDGSLTVVADGIMLNGTIEQKLENPPTQTVTPSCSAGTCTYSNGVFTITTTSDALISWAKLEVGLIKTEYSPRPYAEELNMCQRYYCKFNANSIFYGYSWNNNTARISIKTPVSMRAIPLNVSSFAPSGNNLFTPTGLLVASNATSYFMISNEFCFVVNVTGDIRGGLPITYRANANLELDAEIY